MKTFILRLCIFTSFQICLFSLALLFYSTTDSNNFLAETSVKHERLRQADRGKIVLVGGSSAAFGFSSERVVAAFSRPVVNMGLAAGLGMEFMLSEVRRKLYPGDILVLSFEYEHFSRGFRGGSGVGFDPNLLEQVIVFRPAGFLDLSRVHFRRIVLDRGHRILGAIARRALANLFKRNRNHPLAERNPSMRRGFNEWGDFVAHRTLEAEGRRIPVHPGHIVASAINYPHPSLCAFLSREVDDLTARGIIVMWSFPPRPEEAINNEPEIALLLDKRLREIPHLVVLDSPLDHVYPTNRFFDTDHHLDSLGANLRTDRLIEVLRLSPAFDVSQ